MLAESRGRVNHSEFNRVREHMAEVLAAEVAKRKERGGQFLEAEIDAIHAAVNNVRRSRALHFVQRWQIERLDNLATGADWSSKFALYCAELAVGMGEVKT